MKKSFYLLLTAVLLFALTSCFALQEAEESSGAAEAENVSAAAGSTVFVIDSEQSEARFTINEVLRGADTVVVGTTNNVAGEVAFDFSNPASATIGQIVINARDIATDNNFRNNAIQNRILETNSYELITFDPTSVSGLPETITVGETYTFQITGDLTITDVTKEVTFDAQVTPTSDTALSGLASAEILYADWGLEIPFSQSVEAVEDNLLLEFEFVANGS